MHTCISATAVRHLRLWECWAPLDKNEVLSWLPGSLEAVLSFQGLAGGAVLSCPDLISIAPVYEAVTRLGSCQRSSLAAGFPFAACKTLAGAAGLWGLGSSEGGWAPEAARPQDLSEPCFSSSVKWGGKLLGVWIKWTNAGCISSIACGTE